MQHGDVFVLMVSRNQNIADLENDLFLNRRAAKIGPATGARSYWMPFLAVGLIFRLQICSAVLGCPLAFLSFEVRKLSPRRFLWCCRSNFGGG